MTDRTDESTADKQEEGSKYLTFGLGGEVYGISALKAKRMIGMMHVARLPQMPDFVRGVINLRGKVIPVMNMCARLGLKPQKDTDRTCIVVVEITDREDSSVPMGVVVDDVHDMTSIREEQIEAPPAAGAAESAGDIIWGRAKLGERVVLLVDIDKAFPGDELEAVDRMSQTELPPQ